MEVAQHIVKLGPIAVELVDRTMIELARGIAMFGPTSGETDSLRGGIALLDRAAPIEEAGAA